MSRPAIAAWYRCHTNRFSASDRSRNPCAYSCTTAASSTRSRRYLRSAGAVAGAAAGAGVVAAAVGAGAFLPPPPQAAHTTIDIRRTILLCIWGPSGMAGLDVLISLSQLQFEPFLVLRDVRRPVQFCLDPRR